MDNRKIIIKKTVLGFSLHYEGDDFAFSSCITYNDAIALVNSILEEREKVKVKLK